jgi:hypothetical protein
VAPPSERPFKSESSSFHVTPFFPRALPFNAITFMISSLQTKSSVLPDFNFNVSQRGGEFQARVIEGSGSTNRGKEAS